MPRVPRKFTVLNGFTIHKTWRGHNKDWVLRHNHEKYTYTEFLNEELEKQRDFKKEDPINTLNAATIMSNHTHEMSHIESQPLLSSQMRIHHMRYGQYYNRLHNRSGKVAEDRPKTCLIADDFHAMTATFYIHANPIRAKIVRDAKDYFWSTHRLYAFGKRERWMRNVVLPGWYMRLGRTAAERQRKYRRLFAKYMKKTGKKRSDLYHKPFNGPSVWMGERKKKLTQWIKSHAPP